LRAAGTRGFTEPVFHRCYIEDRLRGVDLGDLLTDGGNQCGWRKIAADSDAQVDGKILSVGKKEFGIGLLL
jgi:hypothetical protein